MSELTKEDSSVYSSSSELSGEDLSSSDSEEPTLFVIKPPKNSIKLSRVTVAKLSGRKSSAPPSIADTDRNFLNELADNAPLTRAPKSTKSTSDKSKKKPATIPKPNPAYQEAQLKKKLAKNPNNAELKAQLKLVKFAQIQSSRLVIYIKRRKMLLARKKRLTRELAETEAGLVDVRAHIDANVKVVNDI